MSCRPRLRLVEPSPPQPTPRLDVRVSAAAQGEPFGRSRAFHLSQRALDELLHAAARLEAAR
jgi:hypothetical protein